MQIQDFVKLNPAEIRRDANKMRLFVEFYEGAFSIKIGCTPCSFKSYFEQLKRHVELGNVKPKFKPMKKSFEIKSGERNNILFYRSTEGKIVRMYAHQATEEFVQAYLTNGTPKEIEERKAVFVKLPKVDQQDDKAKLEAMKKDELVAYLEDLGLETEGKLKKELLEDALKTL